jgi:hypothetical protein
MVKGLLDIQFFYGFCAGYILGKHSQEKFDKEEEWRASYPLDIVHSDIMGPFLHPSMTMDKYLLTFIDDLLRYTWVYFLKKKSEVFEYLK